MNFHVFVLISTIAFYIILKLYKSSVLYTKNKKKSNFIYVLFAPVLLYLTHYLYIYTPLSSSLPLSTPQQQMIMSDKLLNSAYPVSSSTSSSY
jgi:hypothetical protein